MEFRKKQQIYKLRREHCTLHTQYNSTPTRHPHDLIRENFLESIDISFWRQPVFDNTIGQSNNAVSILGFPLAGNERSSVSMLLSSGGWNIQRTCTETVFQGHTKIALSVVWWSLLLQCLIIPTCHIFDWVSVGNFCLHIYELLCWNIFERWEACH